MGSSPPSIFILHSTRTTTTTTTKRQQQTLQQQQRQRQQLNDQYRVGTTKWPIIRSRINASYSTYSIHIVLVVYWYLSNVCSLINNGEGGQGWREGGQGWGARHRLHFLIVVSFSLQSLSTYCWLIFINQKSKILNTFDSFLLAFLRLINLIFFGGCVEYPFLYQTIKQAKREQSTAKFSVSTALLCTPNPNCFGHFSQLFRPRRSPQTSLARRIYNVFRTINHFLLIW